MTATPVPQLSAVEARVLGVLAEKQRTVPDTYPLTLNALVSGCGQKSSRDPVMEVGDTQAQEAIDSLRSMTLVIESSGGRVPRYEHNMERVLQIPTTSAALLAVLMLRGPQTAGELRINCDRLHRFADISAVEGFLHELAGRPAGALVAELPRQSGSRENRWAHLLCGAPAAAAHRAPAAPASRSNEGEDGAGLQSRIEALEAGVSELQALVAALRSERP
ncbi:MAG: YceH family protein [Burkholderiales bacterium]